jgi:hypothetical protein
MTTQPTILLTFAQNDLRQVAEEAQNLKAIVSQQKVLQYRFIENVSATLLENAVTKCGEAFTFFHFSGHAQETGLMLSDETYLDSGRFHRILFGKSERLQFVFLNGCRSYGHAGYLIAVGSKQSLLRIRMSRMRLLEGCLNDFMNYFC